MRRKNMAGLALGIVALLIFLTAFLARVKT